MFTFSTPNSKHRHSVIFPKLRAKRTSSTQSSKSSNVVHSVIANCNVTKHPYLTPQPTRITSRTSTLWKNCSLPNKKPTTVPVPMSPILLPQHPNGPPPKYQAKTLFHTTNLKSDGLKQFAIQRTDSLGALGEVIIATPNNTNIQVAIQTIEFNQKHRHFTENNKLLPSEIYLLKQLSHPNIISCYHYSFTGTNWLLVLEYNPRWQTLSSLLKNSFGGLCEFDAWFIIQQLLSAVSHCIHKGVDHRNLTTNNILIDPVTLEIKLVNFSCATELSTAIPYSRVAGDANILPPEWYSRRFYQPLQGIVWSLGLLLFEMLCGTKAVLNFDKKGINWNQIANARSPVSDRCLDLLVGCLEYRPEKRLMFSHLCRNEWIVNETEI